jgi:Tol biopolymer transport system component
VQAPAWRPDGGRLVYAVPADGQFDLVELDPATGESRLLTDTPEDEHSPSWSQDGRHLYFVVQSGGGWRLHRLDTVSGERRPLREGVRRAVEDSSGRWLYFTEAARGGLWRMPVAGGEATRLAELAPVDERNWLAAPEGVYVVVRDAAHDATLARLDPESGALHRLAELPELLYKSGLGATAEGIVYARETRREADLVLVENPPLD